MLLLSWLLYFSFGLTQASMFMVIGPIREELALSYTQAGIVLGGWQLVYMIAAVPVGVLLDRFSMKTVLFLGILVVALSQLLRSYANDFGSLLFAVALLGLGGPVVSVGLPKVIATYFTGRPRQLASGIYITGAQTGQMTALAVTSVVMVALADSWRVTLQVYAVVVLVLALVWLIGARSSSPTHTATAVRTSMLAGLKYVVKIRAVWLIVIVGFAGFLASHGYRSWLPELMVSRGFDSTAAGLLAALPAASGLIGSIVVVRFVPRRLRRGLVVTLLAVVGVAMVTVTLVSGAALIAVLAVEGFCAAALLPLMMNTLMELPEVGPRYVSIAAALYFTFGEIGGFAGPVIIGAVVGQTGSFVLGVLAIAVVMWVMIVPALAIPRLPSSGGARDAPQP